MVIFGKKMRGLNTKLCPTVELIRRFKEPISPRKFSIT